MTSINLRPFEAFLPKVYPLEGTLFKEALLNVLSFEIFPFEIFPAKKIFSSPLRENPFVRTFLQRSRFEVLHFTKYLY